jgi:hypothetical protein
MWLYAYESGVKGLNGTSNPNYIRDDPYFGPIFGNQVEFYRSGSFHMNANTILKRLRAERLRRAIQEAAVEHDLAEHVDDFDDLSEDEDQIEDLYLAVYS